MTTVTGQMSIDHDEGAHMTMYRPGCPLCEQMWWARRDRWTAFARELRRHTEGEEFVSISPALLRVIADELDERASLIGKEQPVYRNDLDAGYRSVYGDLQRASGGLSALLDLHHAALGGGLGGYATSQLRQRVEFMIGHGERCGCLVISADKTTDTQLSKPD